MPLIPELEKIIRREETALSLSLILRFLKAGSPFWTEVEVRASGCLFCFSDLQVEYQFPSLRFINCASLRYCLKPTLKGKKVVHLPRIWQWLTGEVVKGQVG